MTNMNREELTRIVNKYERSVNDIIEVCNWCLNNTDYDVVDIKRAGAKQIKDAKEMFLLEIGCMANIATIF